MLKAQAYISDPINTALLVYMLDKAAPIYGRTKVQKVAFHVELDLAKSGKIATTFHFKRWKNGPYSQEVWDTLDRLRRAGFLHSNFELTERGRFLKKLVERLRNDNIDTFAQMDETIDRCQPSTGEELMRSTYNVELEPIGMPTNLMRLEDVPRGVRLIEPGPSTLRIADSVADLIATELDTPKAELEAAEEESDEIIRQASKRLADAIPSGRP